MLAAALPLMQWLEQNASPHCQCIVEVKGDTYSVKLTEDVCMVLTPSDGLRTPPEVRICVDAAHKGADRTVVAHPQPFKVGDEVMLIEDIRAHCKPYAQGTRGGVVGLTGGAMTAMCCVAFRDPTVRGKFDDPVWIEVRYLQHVVAPCETPAEPVFKVGDTVRLRQPEFSDARPTKIRKIVTPGESCELQEQRGNYYRWNNGDLEHVPVVTTTFKEHDVVRMLNDVHLDDCVLVVGMQGTVVHTYPNDTFAVEFEGGRVFDISADDLEPVLHEKTSSHV